MDAEALGSTGNLLHWRLGVNVDDSVHDSIVELVNGDLRLALFPPKLNDTWLVGRKPTTNVRAPNLTDELSLCTNWMRWA